MTTGENSTSRSGKPPPDEIRVPSPGNLQESLLFPTESQIHARRIIFHIYEYFYYVIKDIEEDLSEVILELRFTLREFFSPFHANPNHVDIRKGLAFSD